MREDSEANSQHIYLQCCRNAEKLGTYESMPSTIGVSSIIKIPKALCCRSHGRKKTVAIPFQDYLIGYSSSRLSTHSKQAAPLQVLWGFRNDLRGFLNPRWFAATRALFQLAIYPAQVV